MDIYKVYETDDYGRAEKVIGFVKSDSRENAKREYSIEHYGHTDDPYNKRKITNRYIYGNSLQSRGGITLD